MGKRPKPPQVQQAPAATPDLASQVIRDQVANERRKQLGSAGRKSTFLSGALGDQSFVSTTVKKLMGA